jgi:putative GTP pyrophosphokinase
MNREQIDYFGKYSELLEKTTENVLHNLDEILNGLTSDPENIPYEHINFRIKSADSTRDKLIRKGYREDAHTALMNLSDIIGIRIVTHFVGDIYLILDSLKKHESFTVIKEKDYIAKPKENGYRSFHVIINVPFESDDIDSINIELQLRTIAMDCWAALEHQMRYKKDVKNTSLIASELKRCSDEMASTDLTMQTIRDVLMQ